MTVLSLATILAEAARRHPDKTAVVDGELRTSYRDLWQQTLSYAAGLRALGVGPGDSVAIQIPNVTDFCRVYYATLAVGATIVPMHLLLTPEENAYVLRDSGAKLLVAHVALLEGATAAAGLAGVEVVSVGAGSRSAGAPPRLEDVSSGVTPLRTYESRQAEDVAVVFYTSGTTGRPKGALLTHLNLVMNTMVNVFDIHPFGPDDVVLGGLPLFHTFGQTVGMNATFRMGGTLVLMARFTGEAAIETMVRERVTMFLGVPTMYIGLLEAATKADLLPASLRICVSGGASLPVAVLEQFEKIFSTPVYEGYGLSETSPTATTNQPAYGTKPGTVGHPIWGVEVEIARPDVDDRIELLETGELGEIVLRGHNIFAGYLGNPEATREAVVDGWFRTGDLGTKDADGFLTIVDRKKDMVIRGGFNVYPREVEEVLARHPAVRQVAVIGVPDPVLGEEICAVVVPEAGGITAEELVEWSRDRVGRHKYPRQVRFVEALPLGPSFKVLKRELRERFSG